MLSRTLTLCLLVCTPLFSSAAVQITEIMYDVSGSDAGREWVEITNSGPGTIDLAQYKLFEGNTNHALTGVSGGTVLQPGGSGVIADDDVKFKIDWPTYSGVLFRSSFSLSNSGETLGIKDSALVLLDSVTYDVAQGAAGDGNSLQRSGATFSAAAPTPGAFGAPNVAASSDQTQTPTAQSQTTTQTTNSSQTGGNLPPPITVAIDTPERVMVGGGSFFEAKVYGTERLPLESARIEWNFGDGAVAEGARVFHAYRYPGKYVVWASAAHNYSSAVDRVVVEAVAAQVSLAAEGDGSLLIRNLSPKDLDIGLWSLNDGGKQFTIPEHTTVLVGEGVRFSPLISGLAGSVRAELRYPNAALAASASPGATSPLRGERVMSAGLPVVHTVVQPVSAPRVPTPKETEVSNEPRGEVQGAAVESISLASDATSAWWLSIGGLVVVLASGAGAAYMLRLQPHKSLETSATADEFDIV